MPLETPEFSEYENFDRVPKCASYRAANNTDKCVSIYCERCAALRYNQDLPALTHDNAVYVDNTNIVLGEG